jgi:hypothetical protein
MFMHDMMFYTIYVSNSSYNDKVKFSKTKYCKISKYSVVTAFQPLIQEFEISFEKVDI